MVSNRVQILTSGLLRPPGTKMCVQYIHSIFNDSTPKLIIGDLNAKHKAWGSHFISRAGRLLMSKLHLGSSFETAADVETSVNLLVDRIKEAQARTTTLFQHRRLVASRPRASNEAMAHTQLCHQLTKAAVPKCPIIDRSGVRRYDAKARAETIAEYLPEQFILNPPATSPTLQDHYAQVENRVRKFMDTVSSNTSYRVWYDGLIHKLLTPHGRLHSQELSPVFFNDAVSALPSTTCYPLHARYEQECRRAATYLPNYRHYTPMTYLLCVIASRTGRTTKTVALLTGSQRIMPNQLRRRGQAVEWKTCVR
ncbi:hypothetical protein EVAR_48291_1 [Eumeta japonica]|uniref:RNA-directed DNA polymerase from mobile element jockey n=1 Tax=Eumeta variegata TaxID=151549 RepID=A0A4C1WJS3_EUMVA|nr:hypothetical protein EVAR_48291_1 [Eumeta japonica]